MTRSCMVVLRTPELPQGADPERYAASCRCGWRGEPGVSRRMAEAQGRRHRAKVLEASATRPASAA